MVLARQRARQIAGLLGFEAQDQTRIATAVSEIARNAFQYARRRQGRVPGGRPAPPAVPGPRQRPGAGDQRPAGHPRRALTSRRPAWGWASLGAPPADGPLRRSSRSPGADHRPARQGTCPRRARALTPPVLARVADELARQTPARSLRGGPAAEPGAAAGPGRAEPAPGGAEPSSTASWRTPTAASSPSTPSWTRRPTTCAGPRR